MSVLRIFRHYISLRLLVLLGSEITIVLASVLVWPRLDVSRAGPLVVAPALALGLLVVFMLHLAQLYDGNRFYGRRELLLRVGLAFAGAYVAMAALAYFVRPLRLAHDVYLLSLVVAMPAIYLARLGYYHVMRDSHRRRRVLLLGWSRPGRMIVDTVNGSNPNYEVVGCLDTRAERVDERVDGVAALGTPADLAQVSRATRPDVIVVAMTEQRGSLPLRTILECKFQGVEVDEWPSFYEKLTGKILLTDLRPSWLVFADGFRKSGLTVTLKRGMDVLFASAGLTLTLPLLLLIGALVRLESRGPALIHQQRVGQNGRLFALHKLRSMVADAEAATGPVWAREHDPRVTRVGRVLRRTRLDELPQLWNVLCGEMSLVGPRAERPAFVADLQERIPFYVYRLSVKPGITGWAQVKYGYGATVDDAVEKLQYDLYYIKNLSLFLDLLILLDTLQVVLFMKGSR